MKLHKRYPAPRWLLRKIPGGIIRFNTMGCNLYGIYGLDKKKRDWYWGIFLSAFELTLSLFQDVHYVVDLESRTYYKNT